jgi:UDP-N-acetylglucosamine 3-dehydrogenase
MTKILLMGLGRWGANHVRALKSLPIELFVSDLREQQFEVAQKVGVARDHFSTNYKDFADRVDGVVLVTPAQTHFPLCTEFLNAGKDVFVEKPITLVPSEAKQLCELADARARILQVGHIFRFDTASIWLHAAMRAGKFGRVQMLRSNFSGFKRPRNDSGIMFADAIHFVDLYNYFLDATPRRVTAIAHDFMGRGRHMEDATLLSLEYDTPQGIAWGIVETNYFLPGKYREVAITGSDLSALCDLNAKADKLKIFANRHVPAGGHDFTAEEGAAQIIECPAAEPLLAELQAFTQSITTRRAPLADGWAGYHSVRVLEAAQQSAREARTVTLGE